ncbi:MAG: hypothetical protein NUW37_13805 [Planctomycetes bacterium]|nr:hypothetical protein [Planctomycetota bacterium]
MRKFTTLIAATLLFACLSGCTTLKEEVHQIESPQEPKYNPFDAIFWYGQNFNVPAFLSTPKYEWEDQGVKWEVDGFRVFVRGTVENEPQRHFLISILKQFYPESVIVDELTIGEAPYRDLQTDELYMQFSTTKESYITRHVYKLLKERVVDTQGGSTFVHALNQEVVILSTLPETTFAPLYPEIAKLRDFEGEKARIVYRNIP